MKYQLTKAEVQSGIDRVKWAEGLIEQLPIEHEGRNSWLMNFGTTIESIGMRKARNLKFDRITMACGNCGIDQETKWQKFKRKLKIWQK